MASRWYGLKVLSTYSFRGNGTFQSPTSVTKFSPIAFNIKSLNGRKLIVCTATYSRAMVDKLHICMISKNKLILIAKKKGQTNLYEPFQNNN